MTHKDIYTKFMIEYDKAGASTSYPSLTEYEVATVLDKAYNALIAQKVTGNNVRRATFESDIKSIADLGPLVNTAVLEGASDNSIAPNIFKFDLTIDSEEQETNLLYFLQGSMLYDGPTSFSGHFYTPYTGNPSPDHRTIVSNTVENLQRYRVFEFKGVLGDDIEDSGTSTNSVHLALFYSTKLQKFVIWDQDGYYSDAEDQNTAEMLNHINNADWCIAWHNDNFEGRALPNLNKLFMVSNGKLDNTVIGEYVYNDGQDSHFSMKTSKIQTVIGYSGYDPIDGILTGRGVPVKLVNHEMAQKFFTSASNIPWIKEPVCFIEGHDIFVVYDYLNPPSDTFRITYIKQPNTFVKDLTQFNSGTWTYFTPDSGATDEQESLYKFECNSTVAEELVSLAVAFALENVESQRLNSKLNMRGLEA